MCNIVNVQINVISKETFILAQGMSYELAITELDRVEMNSIEIS